MNAIGFGMVVALILALLGGVLLWRKTRRRAERGATVYSSIQHMRSIGQLSVFRVITKEIVTETDHSWGEFGSTYLSWVLSRRKMAMIFEFAIDFRYDLRRPEFDIVETSDHAYLIRMPPCLHEAHIRDIRFYDEQKSRLLPWLLPELLNGFLADGFTETEKNKMIDAAKGHAEQQARELIESLESEVQQSAKATLKSISKAFGAESVSFEFPTKTNIELDVGIAGKLAS